MNPATKSTRSETDQEKRFRVSIVDDDSSVCRALDRLCRSAGYVVDLYGSAEDFLEAPGAVETDCLILDVHLLGKNGLQLQTELQASNKQLPIIFITAYDDEPTRAKAIQSGAIEFLRKPLDSEKLLQLIQRVLDENIEDNRPQNIAE